MPLIRDTLDTEEISTLRKKIGDYHFSIAFVRGMIATFGRENAQKLLSEYLGRDVMTQMGF